ncbi:MAG: ribokinase, partial [Actinomycetota bacterium]
MNPSGPRVGVVGSCNVDLVVRGATLPRPGETIVGEDVVRLPGGKGANQAVAAATLGAQVSLLAAVGRDETGEFMIASLRAQGVDVGHVQRSDRPTGTAFITLDQNGQNQIVVAPGANADLSLEGIDLGGFDVVVAQMEISATVVADAANRSKRFILNVAPAGPVAPAVLNQCAVVIANEIEIELFDVAQLADCIVTLGARGAVHYQKGREVLRVGAPRVEVVDTVGAGDVFCAAYAVQLARHASADDALRFAVTAGALATRGVGAQGALPT